MYLVFYFGLYYGPFGTKTDAHVWLAERPEVDADASVLPLRQP